MKLEVSGDIDSTCYAPEPERDMGECGGEAVTYAVLKSGVRVYLCEDHAEEAARFDDRDDDFETGPHPKVAACRACGKVTPVAKTNVSGTCPDCS